MKVFVTRKIPAKALDDLVNSGHEVEVSQFDRILTAQELIEKSKDHDALLTLLTDKITKEVLDQLGDNIKIISNYAVGFDNIDIAAATEKGIVVTNTPCDEVNESVAEMTWALMLALARRVVEADQVTRQGAYKGWEPAIFLGQLLRGKTLGIVGMGRIGGMVARRAKGFEMRVLYNNRSRDEKAEQETGAEFVEMDRLLSESDFVSIHVPLTDETRGMINSEKFSKMKHGIILINTARGPIVKEQDLVEALRDGKLGGAGLDVYENEPIINPELVGMENVIMTPHIASATHEAREAMGRLAVDAILGTFNDQMPQNIVNKDVWEKRRK
jgi:glyoxylate reductase